MSVNTQRLKELAKPRNEQALKRDLERRMNRKWLTYSQDIALALHYYMRTNSMTQRELAEQMGVSPVYIGKLLKGGENLTLETICKIQEVVGEQLISISKPYEPSIIIALSAPYYASHHTEHSQVYRKNLNEGSCFPRLRTDHLQIACC